MGIYTILKQLFSPFKNGTELQKGTKLNGGIYRIIDVVGKGGFGIVYKAEWDNNLYKIVAIKEFYMSDLCDRKQSKVYVTLSKKENYENLKRRFENEACRMKNFSNPNIVKVFDYFEQNNTVYIVMEFIEGCSLQYKIEQEKKIPIHFALKYILDIGNALTCIHNNKAIHLDVKPSNIMLDKKTGNAILIDFGMAKHYTDLNPKSIKTTLIGFTQGFAPIEQYDNEKKIFEPCSDVYALASTFYYCVTGIVPPSSINRSSGKDTLEKISHFLNGEVNESMDEVINKAMEVKPTDRFQSIDEFIKALKAISKDLLQKLEEAKSNNEFQNFQEEKKLEDEKLIQRPNKKGRKGEKPTLPIDNDLSKNIKSSKSSQTILFRMNKYWRGISKTAKSLVLSILGSLIAAFIIYSFTKPEKDSISSGQKLEINKDTTSQLSDSVVYTEIEVEVKPSFPEDIKQYIKQHLRYPKTAQEEGKQGEVSCLFVINTDGSISDVTVVHSIDPLLDKEAIRIIKNMPKWNPGKIKGQAVQVKCELPIKFILPPTPCQHTKITLSGKLNESKLMECINDIRNSDLCKDDKENIIRFIKNRLASNVMIKKYGSYKEEYQFDEKWIYGISIQEIYQLEYNEESKISKIIFR